MGIQPPNAFRPDPSPARLLRLTFLYNNLRFSGGRKVLQDYAQHLRGRGHFVTALGRNVSCEDTKCINAHEVQEVPVLDRSTIPESDLLIASEHDEVRDAVRSGRGPVVHFCQGFQILDYEYRLQHNLLPERYHRRFLRFLQLWRQRQKWKRRIREFDSIYRLPTHLICISRELTKHLETRYGRPVELVENGICPDHFTPPNPPLPWQFDARHPCRILSVGSSQLVVKGIEETTDAVRQLKVRGYPVQFVRVSPHGLSDKELQSRLVDEIHTGLTQFQMAELYRSCHVYVSNSHPAEGFGLPAMEALRSGLVTVLSDIPCYRSYADHRRFTKFVPVNSPTSTAEALKELLNAPQTTIETLRHEAQAVAERFTLDNSRHHFEAALLRIAGVHFEKSSQAA